LYNPPKAYAEFKGQVTEALRELVQVAEANRGSVLAITHGAVIETMLRVLVCNDAVRFRPYNATLTLIEWKVGRWHLVYLNFWDYLPVELRTV